MQKTLLLSPMDVLFFRDGRPMTGSLTGHTAAWCPPHLVNYALHGALRRHSDDTEQYGSIATAGPFPVDAEGHWYFPTPADLFKTRDDKSALGIKPAEDRIDLGVKPARQQNPSSLPQPLTHSLPATCPPSKDHNPGQWLRDDAWANYLSGNMKLLTENRKEFFRFDKDIGDFEATIGIGLDRETGAQDGERFYSAQYLRLKDGWKLGGYVQTQEGTAEDEALTALLAKPTKLVLGGQQRVCNVESLSTAFAFPTGPQQFPQGLVKWVLLSPVVFPEIVKTKKHPEAIPHLGGWLPNWINKATGEVLLKIKNKNLRKNSDENRKEWQKRLRCDAQPIAARLIAAKIGNAQPISGWALKDGAKPTQLAVPAGSVYYFQCESEEEAQKLAAVLNPPNRRSTLWGELGYGFGVCAPFECI